MRRRGTRTTEETTGASKRAIVWLAGGALLGLVAATGALLSGSQRGRTDLPDGAIATVNGVALRSSEYERAVAALASDRRDPLDVAERRFVLERLIDEELLVQRAVELGLVQSDRAVRGQLVTVMLASVTDDAAHREPDEDELRAFHAEHEAWFQEPARLHVRQLWVRGAPNRTSEAARERAAEAAERVRAGEPFSVVAAALGDAPVAPLPDLPLPPAKLVEYAGPGVLEALANAADGSLTDPVPWAGGYQVLERVAETPARTRSFEEAAEQVAAEWRRRTNEAALRDYLAELRERAEIRLAERTP